MRAYIAFTKKELTESLRTYKLLIILAVFLLFGVMSPLLAKLMPVLLESIATEGMTIHVQEPTELDSWMQFFKNVGQMGMLVLVILFAGIMANEFSRGTLVNILTKGLKRHTVILSKFTASTVIWTMSYLLCLAVTYCYTAYFWDSTGLNHVFLVFSGLWLFGILLIALLIFGGTLFKTFSGSLFLCGSAVVIMTLLSIIPNTQKYNPIILAGDNTALLAAQREISDFVPALAVCIVLIILLLSASVTVFNKKQV